MACALAACVATPDLEYADPPPAEDPRVGAATPLQGDAGAATASTTTSATDAAASPGCAGDERARHGDCKHDR